MRNVGLALSIAVAASFRMPLETVCPGATVGDPGHPADLNSALAEAYKSGGRDITITPGTYDLPPAAKDALALDHWSDVKVHASGVILIFQGLGWSHRPIRFDHCTNVLFEGATVRLSVPAATQGRVKEIGSDDKGPYCDWQVDAGFRGDMNLLKSTFNVVDRQTRLLKVQTGDFSPTSSDSQGPNLFRFRFGHGMPKFEVGDWLVTRVEAGSVICHVDESNEVALRNLTLENGGFATIFETGGGSNHYLHNRITFGPKPAGATEAQVVSCGADGFHSVGTTKGPDIEDCDFEGVFLDDCIAIHGSFQKVVSSSGSTLVLDGGGNQYGVNEPVRISNGKGFFEQAICVGVKPVEGKDHHLKITLDRALDIPADAKANNPNRCGRGFRIVNCRLGNTRSRGILVKSDDGLIDHCSIEGCGMSAISIGPEYYWGEANYCWNVTVSNNTIRNCVKRNGDDGTILVHGDGAIGNRNIIIKDNQFDANFGQSLMKLEWTNGLEISGNKITHPFQISSSNPGHIVEVSHSRNVKLAGNTVADLGPGAGKLLEVREDVAGISGEGETGIRKQ